MKRVPSVTKVAQPASTQSEMVRVPVFAPNASGLAEAIGRALDEQQPAHGHGPERECLTCGRCSDCADGQGGCRCDAVAEYEFEGMDEGWWG